MAGRESAVDAVGGESRVYTCLAMRMGVVLAAAALLAACIGSGPTPPTPTATRTAFVAPATLPPSPSSLGPAPGVLMPPTATAPPPGADRARSEIERVLAGTTRDDLLSLLATAERTGDEAQRYQAYLGAWQYLRDEYFAKGQPPEYRAVLEAIETVARGFPQYQPAQFGLQSF